MRSSEIKSFDHDEDSTADTTVLGSHQQLLELYEREYGAHDIRLIEVLSNLAESQLELSALSAARDLLKRALKLQQQHYDENAIEITATRNRLAEVYRDLGDTKQAKALWSEVLLGQQRHYGLEHINTVATLVNLAEAYSDQTDENNDINGIYQGKILLKRALKITERHYGENYVKTTELRYRLDSLNTQLATISSRSASRSYSNSSSAMWSNPAIEQQERQPEEKKADKRKRCVVS